MQSTRSDITELLKNEYFVQWIVRPTVQSEHYWSKWIQSHPEQKKEIEAARQIIQSAHYTIDEKMPEHLYDNVLENIVTYSQTRKSRTHHLPAINWGAFRVAASIVLLISLGLFIANQKGLFRVGHLETVANVSKSTEWGQKKTVVLPDGSTVKLNAGSSLTYPEKFNNSFREVELMGEAFFIVQSDKNHPFIVRTKGIKTTVLGTEFNINAYSYNTKAIVTLAEGKVHVAPITSQISSSKDHVILTPGEQASLDFSTGKFSKREVSVALYTSWKDGILLFQDEPLMVVFEKLTRWYGVDFDLPPALSKSGCLLNGEFKDESLDIVLQSISLVHGFEYEFKDKKMIEIRGDTCK